jgi:hypothetical protein
MKEKPRITVLMGLQQRQGSLIEAVCSDIYDMKWTV